MGELACGEVLLEVRRQFLAHAAWVVQVGVGKGDGEFFVRGEQAFFVTVADLIYLPLRCQPSRRARS